MAVSDNAVRLAVVGKLAWIKRKRARFQAQPRQSEREMVSGESHYFLGRRYRLRVVEHKGAGKVVLRNTNTLELQVRRGTDATKRERVLQRWYREYLRNAVPPLMAKWEAILGVQSTGWGIKKMKTKWGACSVAARRIWLNLEIGEKAGAVPRISHCSRTHSPHRAASQRAVHLPVGQHLPKLADVPAGKEQEAPLAHNTWSY